MSKNSEAVKRWRRNAKARLIRGFGGSCCLCGYNKCDDVFEFHHLDPSHKETHWGAMRSSITGWNNIVLEMVKCVMLCSNCHKEVHAGAAEVPITAPRLTLDAVNYRDDERSNDYDACGVCGEQKLKNRKTCSQKCAASRRMKVDWNGHDLPALVLQHGSYEAVGDLFGVTGAAVSRKLSQLETGKW